MITQKQLKKLFKYDSKTGLFIRKEDNTIAGYIDVLSGYAKITINGKNYRQHRLAWLYVTGEYPANEIDHINHNKLDNRFVNLRQVTHQENSKNQSIRKDNTSGVCGVGWKKSTKRWFARIRVDGKLQHLGYFAEFSEAVNARKNAEVLYGFHENHGKGK